MLDLLPQALQDRRLDDSCKPVSYDEFPAVRACNGSDPVVQLAQLSDMRLRGGDEAVTC